MTDFKYGDMVCHRGENVPHQHAIMVVGVVTHREAFMCRCPTILPGDLRLMPLDDGLNLISIKDASLWQKCEHLDG